MTNARPNLYPIEKRPGTRLKKRLLLAGLLLAAPGMARPVQMTDLLRCLHAPIHAFEQAMVRQGFVCYQRHRDLQGWTCLFVYQPTLYPVLPDRATAMIDYTHSTRSDVIVYQTSSAQQYAALKNDLVKAGYRRESTGADRDMYRLGRTVISCQPTDQYTGLSGNYKGYTLTLVRRHT